MPPVLLKIKEGGTNTELFPCAQYYTNLNLQPHQIGSVTLIFHGNLKCIESITEKGTHLKINLLSDYAEKTSVDTTEPMQICDTLQILISSLLRKYLSQKSSSITTAPKHFTEERNVLTSK